MTEPFNNVTTEDEQNLADIIWFIKGRMSALADQDRSFELDSGHIESLSRFRIAYADYIGSQI